MQKREEKPLHFTPKFTTPVPPGAETLELPSSRDTPKAQPGISDAKFPSPIFHPQPGAKEEPKSCC